MNLTNFDVVACLHFLLETYNLLTENSFLLLALVQLTQYVSSFTQEICDNLLIIIILFSPIPGPLWMIRVLSAGPTAILICHSATTVHVIGCHHHVCRQHFFHRGHVIEFMD